MESKLKALKVVDLREIISKANVVCPPKAIKADLIASIIASPSAIQVYYQLHPPPQSTDNQTRQVEQVPPKVVLSKPSSPPQTASPANTLDTTKDPEAEKRTQRAARFGIPVLEKPPIVRPGNVTAKPPTSARNLPDDSEKLQARAARFGIQHVPDASMGQKRSAPPEHVDAEEAERRRKRAERFGTTSVAQ